MNKHAIIKLKLKGISNRKVATILGVNRKTVGRYWNEYLEQSEKLLDPNTDTKKIQEKICSKPTYDSSARKRRKYSDEMDKLLDLILEPESLIFCTQIQMCTNSSTKQYQNR